MWGGPSWSARRAVKARPTLDDVGRTFTVRQARRKGAPHIGVLGDYGVHITACQVAVLVE